MFALYPDALEDVNRQLLNLIEIYEHNGSGWVFSNFASLQLKLWHLDPLRARAFVPLLRWIREKRAVVNVTGTGDDCFKWAVLAGMHPVGKHSDRMSKYEEQVNKYDFSSLRFPLPLSSIGSFAKANNLSIKVYGVESDKKLMYPLRVSQTVVLDRHVDLLLYECNSIQHYTIIRTFSRLVSSQLSNHNGATYFCRCLHGCSTRELLEAHAVDCNDTQRKQVPHGFAVSIYPRAEATTDTFCSLCTFRFDSETCQRRCRCYTRCRYWHRVFHTRLSRAYPMQFCVQDSKQCRSRCFTTARHVYR